MIPLETSNQYIFQTGELVHHKKYGYRGVVVSMDPVCTADDSWYLANKSQPDRDQPWYHVLVDESDNATYVAEENLEYAKIKSPIKHPQIHEIFVVFHKGKYHRFSLN